jgi:hypothetical protein
MTKGKRKRISLRLGTVDFRSLLSTGSCSVHPPKIKQKRQTNEVNSIFESDSWTLARQ